MTDSDIQAAPQAGDFTAEGRTVAGGRGWDWIAQGYALFRKQPGIWILMTVVLGVIFMLIGMIPLLGSLANALLFPIIGAGLMLGCKEQEHGGALRIEHLFAGFKYQTGDLVMIGAFNLFGWVVIAFAVFTVLGGGVFMALMHGGLPGAGFSIASLLIALLLVAGLSVPLYMATWFAPALIVLQHLAPADALKASFNACLRNWLPFLVYGVVLLVLCLAAAIPAFLGYLVLVPVMVASIYTSYRDIFFSNR
ncbi:MAG: BPSS1780 family membrane protein [Burkholderiales bacterium]